MMEIRGETIWVNAVLHIVFECIVVYYNMCLDVGKKIFHIGVWVILVK